MHGEPATGRPRLSRRLASLYELALAETGPPPARILEVGCGDGALASALARAEYEVTAIDPKAPAGTIFRSTTLEEFDSEPFDVVVASVSLHHLTDLDVAVAKLRRLLLPGGVLVVEEFAKERLAGATARWHYHQRQALAAVGLRDAPPDGGAEVWLAQWHEAHAEIHAGAAVLAALDAQFTRRHLAWGPFLFDFGLADALEPLERELIAADALAATGFRYVGERTAVAQDAG
jgi:SAM-dependent methyltransferase